MNIIVYGAHWCIDCVNTMNFLESKRIKYDYIDITGDKEAIAFVELINNGRRVVPTLVIDDECYTNPSISDLIKIIN